MTILEHLMSNPICALYLSSDGLTDQLGQSQILPYLSRLSKKNISFHVISLEKKMNFENQEEYVREQVAKTSIQWHPLPYHKTPPLISTLFDLWRMWSLAKVICTSNPVKIVHCRSYPSSLIGMYLKQKYTLKFIFDMRGFWPDERVEGGLWDLRSPIFRLIYGFFKRKEIQFFQSADHIISLTNAGKKMILNGDIIAHHFLGKGKTTKIDRDKISVIPCSVDLTLFDRQKISAEEQTELCARLNIQKSNKVLVYLGSIGTWYLLREMLEFFNRIKGKDPTWKFFMITGENPSVIREEARKLMLPPEDLVIKKVSRHEVPLHLSIADYGIFFIKPCLSKAASSATKMGELLAMGIPVICNSGVGDTNRIITKEIGHLLDLQSPEKDNFREPEVYDPSLIRDKAIEFFALDKAVDIYFKVYSGCSLEKIQPINITEPTE